VSMASSADLTERLVKLLREVSPLGHCFPCLAKLLGVTEKHVREGAQLLVVPPGHFKTEHGACCACSLSAEVISIQP
jgi:hypothetical protein